MQNKRKLHKHLIIIYILYFAVLIGGVLLRLPNFSRGFQIGMAQAQREAVANESGAPTQHSYMLQAELINPQGNLQIDGLPKEMEVISTSLYLSVHEPGAMTVENAFRIHADSKVAYGLVLFSGLSFLAVLVFIALIINSLRISIREELPLSHSNIRRTRIIGILLIVSELCNTAFAYINQQKAVELLAQGPYEVLTSISVNYWNIIMGLLFLFMAEVFTIGTQLSEEQKLTI